MVATSLPLPVGADIIALAILVVAVRGSMVVDVEEEEDPAALGAMVVCSGINKQSVSASEQSVPKSDVANPFTTFTSTPCLFPLVSANKTKQKTAYPAYPRIKIKSSSFLTTETTILRTDEDVIRIR